MFSSLIRVLVSYDGAYKILDRLVRSQPCGPINSVWFWGLHAFYPECKSKSIYYKEHWVTWSKHSCALVLSCPWGSLSRLKKSMFYGAITYSVYTQKAGWRAAPRTAVCAVCKVSGPGTGGANGVLLEHLFSHVLMSSKGDEGWFLFSPNRLTRKSAAPYA